MNDYQTNILEAPLVNSIEEILDCYRSGTSGKINGNLIFQPELLKWNASYLENKYPQKKISIHNNFNVKTDTFDYSKVLLGALISNLEKIESLRIATMPSSERRELYGVMNAKRILNIEFIKDEFRENFRHSFSFLWVGLSPGGLHCDYFDNILLQTSGEKLIRVFPATVSDQISKHHYVTMPDSLNLFSGLNREKYDWLNTLPYYEILLKAGDAAIIPSAAYHAPMALTKDSVSINSFFTPKGYSNFSSAYARKEDKYPWWVTNLSIGASKLIFRLTGRVILHTGHYEVI